MKNFIENEVDNINEIAKIKLGVKMYFLYYEMLKIKTKLDNVAPGISNELTKKSKEIAIDMANNHYVRTEKSQPAGSYILGSINSIFYAGLINSELKNNALKVFLYDQVYRFFL